MDHGLGGGEGRSEMENFRSIDKLKSRLREGANKGYVSSMSTLSKGQNHKNWGIKVSSYTSNLVLRLVITLGLKSEIIPNKSKPSVGQTFLIPGTWLRWWLGGGAQGSPPRTRSSTGAPLGG